MLRLPRAMVLLLALLLVCLFGLAACDCGDDDDDSGGGATGDDDDDDNDGSPDDDDDDDESPDDDDDESPDDDDDDDTSPSPADPYCEAGKDLLRASTGAMAALQFQQGLALDPNAVACRYGLTLADSLRQFDVISILVSYLESFIEGYQPPSRDVPQTGQAFLDDVINLILQNAYFEAADEAIDQVDWLRENAPDVIYTLDTMPIILNFEVVADPHGDYDLPDAVSAQAWAGATAGLLKHLTALNLDFDLGLAFELLTVDFGMPFEELLGVLVDYLLRLFDNPLYPDFFTLKDNAAPFKAAGLETGLGCRHAAETFSLIVAETSPQTNEVLGYDDLNDDQQWQEDEPLIVPPWGPLPAEENAVAWAAAKIFKQLGDSFLDYTAYDSDPANPQPFHLAYLNPLLQALGLPALIPDLDALVIDFGAAYRDADPTGLRDTIVGILHILDLFLP